MHELDAEIAGLLRDLVDFLECLGEVDLPDGQQSTREALLGRTRSALERRSNTGRLDSPEPYLDMSAGKSMLLLQASGDDETDQPLQEYVNTDGRQSQRGSLQHYYETFQDFQGEASEAKANGKTDKELDDVMVLYMSFSAAQAKHKALKSGPLLHVKRERKMFAPFNVFWMNRQCWVSLVGSHLLLYGNERDSRPYQVAPLRGYKCRAAPGALARDPRRSEAAFELYCPGERTFQFAAKSAQEMREWLDAVTESLEPEAKKNRATAATFVEILELESNERMCIELVKEEKEKYQDVLGSPKSKEPKDKSSSVKVTTSEKEKLEKESKEEAPSLPPRTRRLPSLPSQEQVAYEPREELYDEEGLYHRIEDVKAQREYQNCQMLAAQLAKSSNNNNNNNNNNNKENVASVDLIQETYEDTEVFVDTSDEKKDELSETYDDVQSVSRVLEPASYDDCQAAAENPKTKPENDKSPSKASSKSSSSPKRSFLDRVCNRKESLKKDDRKPKSPSAVSPTPAPEPDLPRYDQVSSLPSQVNEEEYLTPPPPRPIYSRPPTIVKCAIPDEIYDDVGSRGDGCRGCANVDVIKDYPRNSSFLSDLQLSIDGQQHYQVPRSGNRKVADYPEDLYDDAMLSESFKNRQRDSGVASPDKSIWSRFGSGKRPRIFEHLSRQISSNEPNEAMEETGEQQQPQTKVKSLQKLISKMENTLGKASKANGVASS